MKYLTIILLTIVLTGCRHYFQTIKVEDKAVEFPYIRRSEKGKERVNYFRDVELWRELKGR